MNRIELHTNTYCSDTLSFLSADRVTFISAKYGCAAVAITDRHSICAYWEAEEEAVCRGIRLIYGLTIVCVDAEDRYAVTVLAKNEQGRRNIFALMKLLEKNQFPFGQCITREQLEEYRDGLLFGASAEDGQLIRAIQLRSGARHLKKIAQTYDYIELPMLPYDAVSQLITIAQECSIPLCAVQNAVIEQNIAEEEFHAFRAINFVRGKEGVPQVYMQPQELEEQFRALYFLPGETSGVEAAFTSGPEQILSQIEEMTPLCKQLCVNWDVFERQQQDVLRIEAEKALNRKYGEYPARGIGKRLEWELERACKLNLAGQILFMRTITQIVQDAGGSITIAGDWGSSFLLYLLDVIELNPLSPDLDRSGWNLCPVSLLGQGKSLFSADIRISPELLPMVKARCAQIYGNQLVEQKVMMRAFDTDENSISIANEYLEEGCDKDIAESLRDSELFYHTVSRYCSRELLDSSIRRICLFPTEVDPLRVPVKRDPNEPILQMETSGMLRFDHIPQITLLDGSAQLVLDDCAHKTGVRYQDIPLDDEAVFEALRAGYRIGGTVTPIIAACKMAGVGVGNANTELFHAMDVKNLGSLSRFMSMSHGTGVWQENQQCLLRGGTLQPEQFITCREDVYRYMTAHGASEIEAASFMESVYMGRPNRQGYLVSEEILLASCGVDPWFEKVCRKISYLFPEAHSLNYAVLLARLVWYALYHPETSDIMMREYA